MEDYIQYLSETIDFNKDLPIQRLVYDGLRSMIMKGAFPLGVRLNEMQMAKNLNISRTPIREAIRQLEFEGFLESIPNYGTVIKQITEDDVIEVYKLRVALESLAFISAMHNMTEEDFDELDTLCQHTLELHQQKDYEQVITCSTKFNQIILDHANMPRLAELLRNLKDYLHRFRTISMTSEVRGAQAIKEHQLIIKAMRNRNEDQIRLIIDEHVNFSKNEILKTMRNEQSV